MSGGILSRFNYAPKRAAAEPFILSSLGRKLGPGYEAPTIEEIGAGLGKICRFAGNSQIFWPVLLHSMVVADLVPQEAKLHALLHDAAEMVSGEVPSPFKPTFFEEREGAILNNLYTSLGVLHPSERVWKLVKIADQEAILGEAAVLGPMGLSEHFGETSPEAEERVLHYMNLFPPMTCICASGTAVITYKHRVRAALAAAKESR